MRISFSPVGAFFVPGGAGELDEGGGGGSVCRESRAGVWPHRHSYQQRIGSMVAGKPVSVQPPAVVICAVVARPPSLLTCPSLPGLANRSLQMTGNQGHPHEEVRLDPLHQCQGDLLPDQVRPHRPPPPSAFASDCAAHPHTQRGTCTLISSIYTGITVTCLPSAPCVSLSLSVTQILPTSYEEKRLRKV